MANKIKLNVSTRENAGKQVKHLREMGEVPAAMYGPKYASRNVTVNEREFKKAFAEAGYSNMIELTTSDGDNERVLVKEVQQHPVNDQILHVSFYVTDAKTEITAEVPVLLTGEAPAEKNNLGFVVHSIESVAVRCLPADLPSEFTVDISNLNDVGESILVSALPLPAGVEFDSKQDVNAPIVVIQAAQKIEDVLAEIEEANAEAAETAAGEEGETAEGAEGGEEGEAETTEE